ncbi:helix-turn-helix transcriptional regulator [Paenibacillus sanfengchensis]|uniref:helix-turn-helix domain-containing protein n=1 Tax=Paenibacillus sanfengchensis TaxID=3119819 RepID=UPI002FE16978
MSIYDRIESLIKAGEMTKKQFCQDLNISTGNLGDWKRGKSTPSTNKLIEIAAYFNVSLDWLLIGQEGKQPFVIKEHQAPYGREIGEILREYGYPLTPREAAFIQEYLEFVKYRRQQENDGD